jgi:hypothetical protein
MSQTSGTVLRLAGSASELAERLEAAVANAPLQTAPFEHIFMERVFTPDAYADILANIPAHRHFHPLRHKDAMRPDGTSTRLRMYLYPEQLWKLPRRQRAVWSGISRALMSRTLQAALLHKFANSLEMRFQRSARALSFFPIPMLLCDRPGYRIGIHADAQSKAITMQFYVPRDGTRSHLGTVFHEGREGEAAARTKSMPYVPASAYAFPVLPRESWHSLPQTCDSDGDRYSMMLIYYVQDTRRAWIKRRYDRLRCFFGVGPKG